MNCARAKIVYVTSANYFKAINDAVLVGKSRTAVTVI